MPPERRILMVAGEPSGDRAAATLVRALKEARPTWSVEAVGGPLLAEAGAEIILPYSELTVMGFAEVIGRLPALRRHLNRLSDSLSSGRYDLFLPVDFPGFNLRLAGRAHAAGVPVLYFIAPQVWAWGKRRVARMRRIIRSLALILPFEEEWFRAEGIQGRFVGHPIMENEPPRADDRGPRSLGLLPGSRAEEVRRHLPVMLATAAELGRRFSDLRVQLLESPGLDPEFYDEALMNSAVSPERRREESMKFLAEQRAVLVASGTATLEAGVVGVPMAVIYRTSAVSFWLARRLVKVDRIALVNLVAGADLVPEFVQGAAEAGALADCMEELLRPGPEREDQRRGLSRLRDKLGSAGCGRRTVALAIEILERDEPGILAR